VGIALEKQIILFLSKHIGKT